MKTDVFNLIILDESGSMSGVTAQTISGCNETINTIRSAQKQYADTQNHYVSIFAFQTDDRIPSRYIVKNAPIGEVKHIDGSDYCPHGCTPLYDAVGSTLVDLRAVVNERELAVGAVTIITDGYENSSRQYTYTQIVKLIDSLKEIGWTFNFIGADIDVDRTANALHMDSSISFCKSAAGTRDMFRKENRSRHAYYDKMNIDIELERSTSGGRMSKGRLFRKFRERADKYFDSDDPKDNKKED